ncbi:MAG: ABC transporter permease [Gemmatales bacterium]|nr:ABC transporter permease [Gemmatales bacterium]MDW8386620.1 ABC transporter permease subunit [Gemmatales bacterium]
MSWTLFVKLLRDIRWPLFFVGLLIFAYELLWAKITSRLLEITPKLLSLFGSFGAMKAFENEVLRGPGELIRSMLGGEMVQINDPQSLLSVGYVHPFIITVYCIWAIGRASGAIAGEIDKGTMELLLAQPIARWKVLTTHLVVDLVTIPVLVACMVLGTAVGIHLFDVYEAAAPVVGPNRPVVIRLEDFARAGINSAALMFAVSGYTIFLSAIGRYRWRVLGVALGVTLVQFLVNILGDVWSPLQAVRPLTVFYYYRPQPIILRLPDQWLVPIGRGFSESAWFMAHVVVTLILVGAVGYLLAIWRFTRRDLPAPL